MEIVIAFLILLVLLVIGVPVAFSFGATVIWLVISLGYDPSFLIPTAYAKLNGVVLMAIPLFILGGAIMARGVIGGKLVDFVSMFVGRVRGSLAIVATLASAVFGSICGSGMATLSCIGSIIAPKMVEKKYPVHIVASVLAAAAPLGLLIPPSIIQILFAWSSQVSVLGCFLATVIPGIILTILISLVGWMMLRKNKDIIVEEKVTIKQWSKKLGKTTFSATPALLMPIIVLGGIYGGIMTPTEAAAVLVVYAIPVSMLIYKGMNGRQLRNTVLEAATSTGVIMVMLALIMVLSRVFIMENVPDQIMDLLLSISENPIIILIMINIFMVVIGMLMDDVSGTLLCAPILLPLMMDLGISPYQFAAILGVNLGMGNITPPCAPILYFSSRVCKVDAHLLFKPTGKIILGAYLPTLILVTYVPEISLFLPRLLGVVS